MTGIDNIIRKSFEDTNKSEKLTTKLERLEKQLKELSNK
jgi:hypothetical protein